MATLKHIASKNADYGAAEQYLTFEHDEFTGKPILDENGRLIPREDYRISSLNCGSEDFAVACMRANLRYGKNQQREDVKSHHYITACPLCAVNMTECVGKEPEPSAPVESEQPDADPEPVKKADSNGLLLVALAAVLAGGSAAYFLKFKKKKPDTKGDADLDDYDYGDAEDEPEDGEDE